MKLFKHTITRILIFSFSFLIFNSFSTFAQEIQWQNTIGGSANDRLYSIQQTFDGGYILGGTSGSTISGDKTEISRGLFDYWVIKTNSEGDIQWQKTIGGDDNDELRFVIQSSDGGYLAGGWTNSNISGDKTENTKGGIDYWIIKLDSIGTITWQKDIGGNNHDYLTTASATVDEGFILGGNSISNISGDKSENSNGSYDYWVVKIDSSGIIQWQNTIGGGGDDRLIKVFQTTDNGFILGGWTRSNISGDKTEDSNGGTDYWIIKLDSVGNIQWQNDIGGLADDDFTAMYPTVDGGILVGGSSFSGLSGDKTEYNYGNVDFWILKLNSSGSIIWQKTIGGYSSDLLNSLIQTGDGSYLVGGTSLSGLSGLKSEISQGYSDYWIVKLDTTGTILYQNTIGGYGFDNLSELIESSNGSIVLGGTSDSDIFGDKSENSVGYSDDYWIVSLTDQFNLIQGTQYADLNSNNIIDTSDPKLSHQKITEINTQSLAFTNQNGYYSIAVFDTGNYHVEPVLNYNYYNTIPSYHNLYFNTLLQVDTTNDFAIQPTGVFNDLCVTMTPATPFRSGFTTAYIINYINKGTTAQNASIIFYPDSLISFLSSYPGATTVTADSVEFNVGLIQPFQEGQIIVTVVVSLNTPISTLINSGVSILPVSGDANPACNNYYQEVLTTGSYDPNDILVSRDTLFTTEFPNPPFLDYIIRFQNTGNDTAFTVKILNPIDTLMLDLSTLEYVASSHSMDMSFIYHERNMRFQFDNILLPDSNTNEPGSHGFVRYRIKPKANLMLGDLINNFAAIYFDFNQPVITNTAVTEIVLPTGLQDSEPSYQQLTLWPNPVKEKLSIFGYFIEKDQTVLIRILDITGRVVWSQKITGYRHGIDVSNLNNGIYFIELQTADRKSIGKFMKY